MVLEQQRYGRIKETQIDKSYINSVEYRRKFDNMTGDRKLDGKIYTESKTILAHRSGTQYEDLTFISTLDGTSKSNTSYAETEIRAGKDENSVIRKVIPTNAMKELVKKSSPNTVIAIHNHPGNSLPSLSDLRSAFANRYKFGIILTHKGEVYKYTITDGFNENFADFLLGRIEKGIKSGNSEITKKYINELSAFGVILEVL
ncbi:MAG: hypothetical protein LBL98_08195 [Ruminococcus sp.]|nr:hypothetical protein [Ruminococcus sp.]